VSIQCIYGKRRLAGILQLCRLQPLFPDIPRAMLQHPLTGSEAWHRLSYKLSWARSSYALNEKGWETALRPLMDLSHQVSLTGGVMNPLPPGKSMPCLEMCSDGSVERKP